MSDKFHVNLREARRISGMTQKEVAQKVGVARSTYALYETGERSPDVEVVKKLAEVLGVSGDYLIGNVKTKGMTRYTVLFEKLEKKYGIERLTAYMDALHKLISEDNQ